MVRFKNRYITIEVEPVKIPKTNSWELDTGKLYKAIVNTLSTLHGDFGVASTTGGFSVKYCNKETKIGIIRCRHGPHKLIASIIPFIKQIDNNQVQLNTLYTGATLHQCYKFIKSYQLNHLRKFYSMLHDVEKHKYFEYEKSAMDLKVFNKTK